MSGWGWVALAYLVFLVLAVAPAMLSSRISREEELAEWLHRFDPADDEKEAA